MTALFALLLCLPLNPAQNEQEPVPTPKPQEPEVVIIGQRRESDILDVPSAVTVVTAEQIEKSGASNIVEVVQRQPGFFSQGANKGAYDQIVDLRGYANGAGNGQRTLVLVDGRRTNSVAASATDWASIPLENIERIEIVRGPAAALYGDGALAGVINVITRKGGKDAFSNFVSSMGNWGTYRSAFNVGGLDKDLSFDLYGGAEGSEGWRDNSAYEGHNFTGRLEAPLADALSGFVKLGRHADTRERPGTVNRDDIRMFGRRASVTRGNESAREQDYVDTGLTQSLGGFGEASLFLNHTQDEETANFGAFVTDEASQITMVQLKHVVTPKLFSRPATFTSGIDLSHEAADAESAFGPVDPDTSSYHRRLWGVYHHAELRPLDFLILTASARYDRATLDLDRDITPFGWGDSFDRDRTFDQWSPHAGVTLKPLEEVSLYASWGRTFKYPTRDELIGVFANNPELDPERANVYETGARYRASWGSASTTWYHMEVRDEIFYDPAFAYATPFGPSTGHNLNFDEVTHQGVESEARVTPWEGLEIFATHTFTRVIITDSLNPDQEGKRYPVTPEMAGTLGATVKYEGAALTVGGRYAGARYLINDFANTEERLGSYWVLDAKVSWTWRDLTAFISVFNLADREYFDSAGMGFNPTTFALEQRFNPAPERSWLVGGELKF